MNICGCSDNRMDQAGVLIDANMDLPLVAFVGLVPLWIALASFVVGGAGGGDQGGINDRPLSL